MGGHSIISTIFPRNPGGSTNTSANATLIGKGHGTGFIRQRMQELFGQGVPALATDPSPKNKRAISVYEKLGFRIVGPARETQWGTVLPMEAWAAS